MGQLLDVVGQFVVAQSVAKVVDEGEGSDRVDPSDGSECDEHGRATLDSEDDGDGARQHRPHDALRRYHERGAGVGTMQAVDVWSRIFLAMHGAPPRARADQTSRRTCDLVKAPP